MNQGDGTFNGGFVGGSKNPLRAPTMVAFADYDGDGDLDFYRTATRLISMNEIFDGKFGIAEKLLIEEFLEGEIFDEMIESLTLQAQEESLNSLN